MAMLCLLADCRSQAGQLTDEALDLYCLRLSCPEVKGWRRDGRGDIWLNLENGKKVLYASSRAAPGQIGDAAWSMKQIYPLEPLRPDTPPGFAPGRKRPYELFEALHGASRKEVTRNLKRVALLGKSVSLSSRAAQALAGADQELRKLLADDGRLKKLLKPEGGYYWRNIAGENALSAHSYGIALDMGADAAPYWRWSRQMPHPMQKSYPAEIVRLFENRGFIWGGKWHEYDLMHFEYRPELICKARMLRFMERPFNLPPQIKAGAKAAPIH